MEGGDGNRRRRSFADHKTDSSNNLRDLLRVRDDENNGRNNLSGLTLRSVLSADKRQSPVHQNRTLLDIIRDDSIGNKDNKKSWKHFKEKLRLRRAGAAWTSTVHIPTSDIPIQQNSNLIISRTNSNRFPTTNVPNSNEATYEELSSSSSTFANNGGETRLELSSLSSNRAMMLRRNSSRIPERRLTSSQSNISQLAGQNRQLSSTDAGEGTEEGLPDTPESVEAEEVAGTEEAVEEGRGEAPVRMSLMSLLAETDRQLGLDGSEYMMDDEDEEEEEEEEARGGDGGRCGGVEYNNCCVCMVRHKGAAFIPCGHTFCRLCSRELWVQRGNCPLCNGYILEILDIF